MRAREPDASGYVGDNGVRVYYESFGAGERTIVFVPADVLVTSRMWKAQVPYLARSHRVVVIDPPGNGRSDKPVDPAAYTDTAMVDHWLAVMDELGIERAVVAGLCQSAFYALAAAATHPGRVEAAVVIGTWAITGYPRVDRGTDAYDDVLATFEAPYVDQQGWHLLNRELWLADWPRWPEFFFGQIVNDAHGSKVYEDLVEWACQSNGPAQVAAAMADYSAETPEATARLMRRVRCPVLLIHGTHDFCQPLGRGVDVARLVRGELVALGGAGHVPTGRDPVPVNHAITDFLRRLGTGEATARSGGPLPVRAHLSARRDLPTRLPGGTRHGEATAYGDGPDVVVVRPPGEAEAAAWEGQLPALSRHARILVPDGADATSVTDAMTRAGVGRAALVTPPGCGALAELLRDRFAAVLRVEAPATVAAQPGLLAFFFDQLDRPRTPTQLLEAFGDRVGTPASGRAAVVLVVDEAAQAEGIRADAVVTVSGGVAGPLPRPSRQRRDRRLLFLSSSIGLGHVRRDLAVVEALRRRHPGVRVDWLSQSPVTDFLVRVGEHVHPASKWLATESGHIESEAGEHDLHAFQAIRRMDEVLVNNFHVFDDLVSRQEYDAWVGDEAWDLDHFLHENPRLKRAPFVWLTDFVGWLPMPDGGEHEAALTADYNAEMVEHVARFPHLRDRSVFVGDPDDVVEDPLGPGLPTIRGWTEEHFDFCGYVMGARPDPAGRERLRARLGYHPDEQVCLVSVGGSGVGGALIDRVVAAYDACRERVPSLRMHVVTGPRLDPAAVVAPEGVRVDGFVPDLQLHHAACDIAVVQGGLSTTMELTAAGRPFLYFPLRHHFEQQLHVRHRLERHGAGRLMDYASADPEVIADALVAELERPLSYLPVPEGGAERAAALVAEVL